jgi:hypothetical protein
MEQYLRSTKGRALTQIVGEDETRSYWRQRQASLWCSRGLILVTLYALAAAALWRTIASFWVFVGAAALVWLLPFVYVMALGWIQAFRLGRVFGVRFSAAMNMPLGDPERLPEWARSNNAKHVYPFGGAGQDDDPEQRSSQADAGRA